MPCLSISLLNSFRVTLDGQPVRGFESDKVRALLAHLAVESDRAHRREELAGLLWADCPEATARQSLSQALSNLRQAIGDRDATHPECGARAQRGNEPFILVSRPTLQFNARSDHELDTATFARLLDDCRKHQAGVSEPESCCLERAMALYQGDMLQGFSLADSPLFEEWLLLMRERLHRQAQEALERLVRCCEGRGETERALVHGWRWVELDPWREEAHRDLMRLLALSGQRSAALAQYEVCRRALVEELGVEPQERTTQLYEQIRDGGIGQARGQREPDRKVESPTFHNLPASLTPLIGREAELAEIEKRLQDPGCRLLTLLGLGGMGKTHLAIEAASRVLSARAFPDGVYMVPLVGVQSVDGIVPAIAETVGLSFSVSAMAGSRGNTPRQQLFDYLRQKRMLLILDNVEHLIEGVGILTDLLQTAPGLKLMVTTRARLNAQGERAILLEGLAYPAEHPPAGSAPGSRPAGWVEPAGGSIYPAVQLFLTTAQRISPQFEPTAGDLVEIARICRMAQGMPLALILAAGWIETLSPAEMAIEMGKGLGILATDSGDLPARLRSMRTVFDGSWALVDERRREVFRGLSVFRGGFTRQAAQYVTGATLDELMALVNKARLHRTPGGRFEVHELLRQYAQEKLEQTPDEGREARDRHCAYYMAALRHWDGDLKSARQQVALEEMEVEIDNARASWDCAVEQRQVERLAGSLEALCTFYDLRIRYPEGESLCRLASHPVLELLGDVRTGECTRGELPRALANILVWQSHFSRLVGDSEAASRLLDQASGYLDDPSVADLDTRREKAFILYQMGVIAMRTDRARAAQLYTDSLAQYRAAGDRRRTAMVLGSMGALVHSLNDYDESERWYRQALEVQRDLGDQRGIADSLVWLGNNEIRLGRIEEGGRVVRQGAEILQALGDRAGVASALFRLGVSALWAGQSAECHALFEQAVAIYEGLGSRYDQVYSKIFLAWARTFLGRYEEAQPVFEETVARSREWGFQRELAFSLCGVGCVAMAVGDFASGQRMLLESQAIYGELQQQEELGWTWGFMAYAERGLGHSGQARRCLRNALEAEAQVRGFMLAMIALPAAALLLADRGDAERATELYALALRYPFDANQRWMDDMAGQHLAAVAAALPPATLQAAQARGRARDLQATMAQLLAELPADLGERHVEE